MLLMNRRVDSFTLVELIVVLMISSFLIVFMVSGWYFVNRFYQQMEKTNEQVRKLYQLDQQLRDDFDRALWVSERERGLFLQLPKHAVLYKFYPMYIVRNQNVRVDTFLLEIQDYKTEFIETANGQELVTLLQLYPQAVDSRKILYQKKYDAQTLLNSELQIEKQMD